MKPATYCDAIESHITQYTLTETDRNLLQAWFNQAHTNPDNPSANVQEQE